jgi:hypothetical protein
MGLTFEDNLKTGRVSEKYIGRWIRDRGNSILPIYETEYHTGKGPQFFAPIGEYVAPDMLVFTRAWGVLWCEAKHKSVFSWHRKTQRWTTGIDLRHYEDYQHVARITKLPVWLLFLHQNSTPNPRDINCGCPKKCPTGLFGQELGFLVEHENHRSMNHGRSGMVYWAETSLRFLDSVAEVKAIPRSK